ncbi:MAG: hypothetical protein C0403_18385 [Desulfobacterium sp.]|nr:hypothetical protein [Desulfobacterium sp.]
MVKQGKDKFGIDRDYLKFIKAYTLCQEKADYPFQWLMVEPTNHCNLKCVMCPQAGKITREKGYMEFSLFQKIVDESKDFLKSMQLFHSGEPFLHPRIFDMISAAASKNIYTLINTNGTLLDENKAGAVLDSGLHSISFSFDSFHKETYESVRVGANYEKTLQNMERLLKRKAQKNLKWPKTIIEIVEMLDTRPHIDCFIQQAKNMGFDDVRVWKFHNWTDADEVADQHNPFSINTGSFYPCEYPFFLMAVYWDASVAPCCIDYNGSYPLGNVIESSLQSIWNGSQARQLRGSMRTRMTPKTRLCRDCSFLTVPRSNRSLAGRLFCSYARIIGAFRR